MVDNGGPAFPASVAAIHGMATNSAEFGMPGMSLRDYFAAKALNGILSDAQSVAALRAHFGGDKTTVRITEACYEFADAMLAAREAK